MKYKIEQNSEDSQSFLATAGMDFDVVSDSEKSYKAEKLCGLSGINIGNLMKTNIFK